MADLDELVLKNHLKEIQNTYQDQDRIYLISCVTSFLELSNYLLDKIALLQISSEETNNEYENKIDTINSELHMYQHMLSQLQKVQYESQIKEANLYDKIVSLEQELQEAQTQIIFQSQQLNKLSLHEEQQENVDHLLIELNQKQIQNTQFSKQIQYWKEQSQQLTKSKQELLNNHNTTLQSLSLIDQQLQNKNNEIVHLKHQIKTLKDNLQSIVSMQTSAMKDISNSPFLKPLSSNTIKYQSNKYQEEDNEENDICEVKQFTIENEIPDNTKQLFRIDRLSHGKLTHLDHPPQLKRLASLLPDSPKQINQHIPQRNIYQDFFTLLCQCAKLNLQNEKVYEIKTQHLFEEYKSKLIPFHLWYQYITQYLTQQL